MARRRGTCSSASTPGWACGNAAPYIQTSPGNFNGTYSLETLRVDA
jgi:hypothetical protein